MNKALRIRVCGRVQGVGFRYWALRAARNLSLSGWVRNEDDGSVSAHCEGPAEDLSAFVALLRQGKPGRSRPEGTGKGSPWCIKKKNRPDGTVFLSPGAGAGATRFICREWSRKPPCPGIRQRCPACPRCA